MKNYNYDLAKKIVDTMANLNVAERICMGMKEDWFWTAQEIWNNEDGNAVELLSNEDADKMFKEFQDKRASGKLSRFLEEKDENGLHKFNPELEK